MCNTEQFNLLYRDDDIDQVYINKETVSSKQSKYHKISLIFCITQLKYVSERNIRKVENVVKGRLQFG